MSAVPVTSKVAWRLPHCHLCKPCSQCLLSQGWPPGPGAELCLARRSQCLASHLGSPKNSNLRTPDPLPPKDSYYFIRTGA